MAEQVLLRLVGSETVSTTVFTPTPKGPEGLKDRVTGSPSRSKEPLSMSAAVAEALQLPPACRVMSWQTAVGVELQFCPLTVMVVLQVLELPEESV